jgi:hypothetical protein
MKRTLVLIAALTALLGASLVANLGPANSAARVPEPKKDPFYAVPANVASYAPGAIIASRPVTTIAYLAPAPATTSWQILYRTNDSHGAPTATVTTLMVPKKAAATSGPRPLVSYQTAEDGVGDQCAPSYGLRAGLFPSGFSNSAAEFGLMMLALSKGWAVTVPDYEGPDGQFLAGRLEGQAVLDGIRATLAFAPGKLVADAPIGMWGYSGGSLATSIAAQLETSYAPELNMQGVALGGLVADIRSTILKFSGTPVGGALAMGVNGPLRAFPEANLAQYLSPSGLAKVQAASDDCIADAVIRYPGLSIEKIEAFPGAMQTPAVVDLLRANSPLGIAGRPTAPIYDYHAVQDELAPIGPDRELMRRYCADGAVVEHLERKVGEHITEVVAGAPGAVAFLAQRFAGKAPRNTCTAIPAP